MKKYLRISIILVLSALFLMVVSLSSGKAEAASVKLNKSETTVVAKHEKPAPPSVKKPEPPKPPHTVKRPEPPRPPKVKRKPKPEPRRTPPPPRPKPAPRRRKNDKDKEIVDDLLKLLIIAVAKS